jgi:hypothetical protein
MDGGFFLPEQACHHCAHGQAHGSGSTTLFKSFLFHLIEFAKAPYHGQAKTSHED